MIARATAGFSALAAGHLQGRRVAEEFSRDGKVHGTRPDPACFSTAATDLRYAQAQPHYTAARKAATPVIGCSLRKLRGLGFRVWSVRHRGAPSRSAGIGILQNFGRRESSHPGSLAAFFSLMGIITGTEGKGAGFILFF